MKLDKSTYYPKSTLDDLPEDEIFEEMASAAETQVEQEADRKPEIMPAAENERENSEEDTGYEEEPMSDQDFSEGGRAMTLFSRIISWVLVPIMMPVYGVMLAFGLSILSFTDFRVRLIFTLITAAINVVIPSVTGLLLKRMGVVSDIGLNKRRERFIPYMICVICLVATAIFFGMKGAPMWLVMFFYGGAATGIVELIVNMWWKISVHAAGMAGLVALLLRIMIEGYAPESMLAWVIVAIALCGVLGASRIWLGRHTPAQVFAGYAVGFCGVFFMMMIQ